MEKLAAHPSREELSAYSLGQLPEERAVAIDSHISECEPCCETIVELSSEDTFAGLLLEAGRLPTDQTADHDSATANSASFDDIPQPLAKHPRYEVLGLIGKGGMGDVYKARHRKMERTVALKVINRGLVQKAEAIDRFHREVKAAAQLSHPNIVTSHDADHAGDFHFMVMEFIQGVDLSQTVKKRGALPVAEACDYIRQAALGLQHAHERGMVHRDIKPHNLMVTADGIIKILDFGLASLAPESIPASDAVAARAELTAAGAIMGTPDFISPEQANDARQVDIRSDIYSLGATLYYLLSGRVPFDDGSVMHKLRSHAQVEPVPLNSVRDDVPEKLVAIASKMMAKDPAERYLTPKEVADALESFLRTWQPNGANSQGQLLLGGGSNFEPGGQNSGAGDAGRDWLLVIARVLFAIAWIPVALLCYETWAFDRANPDVGAGYRTWAYTLVTLCLSTIAGIAFAVHRLNSGRGQSNRGDRRVFRMTASEALTVAAVLIAGCLAAGLYYTNGKIGGVRVEVTAPEDIGSLGTHPLTIVDTSGKKPLGGTSRTHQDDAAGITTHSFESANGRYKITLVNDVLTVNGEKYTLENPNDSIRIVDDRVEITRVVDLPKDGGAEQEIEQLQGEWDVIAFTQDGKKEFAADQGVGVLVQIKGDTMTRIQTGPDGEKSEKDWGRIEINSRTNPKSIDFVNPDRLGGRLLGIYELKEGTLKLCFVEQRNVDDAQRSPGKRPTTFDAPVGSEMALLECRRVDADPDQKQLRGDSVNEVDLGLLQGDWETVSLTEGAKTLAAEDGFGGLLLQIQGNKFVIAERKPDGEKSEVDTGRIEVNSTATPKTIDFIGRDERRLGFYELKHGVLRVCLVEQAGTDAPRDERIPDTQTLKRPKTFESPTGSNMMLMEFHRKQPDANTEQQTRNLLDTTYISNNTVGLLVAHPQRILSAKSKVQEELDQMFAKVAESERLDFRSLSQIVVQLGPPPLSSSPIKNLFDEQLWTVILRFDDPLDVEAYIDKYAPGYSKANHKHSTYYKHDSRMEMWFPDNRTLILAAERRILNLIDDPQGKGPMALRMRRADPMADLLLEIDVRQGGPLLLESLPSELLEPELRPLIEQTLQKIKHITLSAKQNSDTPIQARFHAVDAEKANELLAQAVVWLEAAKTEWPKLRDLIRERPADKDTTPPNRRALALAFANEIDSVLPALRSTVDEDQLLVRLEQEGGVDLATLLVFFLLID